MLSLRSNGVPGCFGGEYIRVPSKGTISTGVQGFLGSFWAVSIERTVVSVFVKKELEENGSFERNHEGSTRVLGFWGL